MHSGNDWDSSREGIEVGISITGIVWSPIVLILSPGLLMFTSHVSGPINLK